MTTSLRREQFLRALRIIDGCGIRFRASMKPIESFPYGSGFVRWRVHRYEDVWLVVETIVGAIEHVDLLDGTPTKYREEQFVAAFDIRREPDIKRLIAKRRSRYKETSDEAQQ